jgi:hypothetical protein
MFRSLKARAAAGFVVALSVGMVVGVAGPASAASNAQNAKLCQKGGWKTLVSATADSFKNQGACVSYAAHGGTFGPPCYSSSTGSIFGDFQLTAPLDTEANALSFNSDDGTCTDSAWRYTIVSATTSSAASDKCDALGNTFAYANVSSLGYSVPADWWACAARY